MFNAYYGLNKDKNRKQEIAVCLQFCLDCKGRRFYNCLSEVFTFLANFFIAHYKINLSVNQALFVALPVIGIFQVITLEKIFSDHNSLTH